MSAWRRTSVVLCVMSFALCAAVRLHGGQAAPLASSDVLLVFEYDGVFDWEAVRVGDTTTTDSAIQWMRDLSDRLTESSVNPDGQDLMIPRQWWIPESVEHLRLRRGWRQDVTLRSVIEGQLSEGSSFVILPKSLLVLYQLTMLPEGPAIANLHVTLARTFWHAVEATGEVEQLVHKSAMDAEAQLIVPITAYIVILPQNWVVHGQETWQGAFVSSKYQDHSLWSNAFVVEMLQYFFHMADAISVPQLDEFAWRMNKVEMLHIYQQKYQQDPEHSVPPIPSQIIHPPVPAHVLAELCFSARYHRDQPAVAREHVHATVLALLHAAHTLESDSDARQIQQQNQVESVPKRKYFVKRNYAGLSRGVISFALTNECSWQEDQSLAPNQQDNATACRHDFHAMLHDAQQVYGAAERIVRQSCHEDWLLQPYIPDIQEYRVFLIGGGDARANEAVPVFMPTRFVDDQMLARILTLPKGYFSARSTSPELEGQPARLQELYPNGIPNGTPDIYFQDSFPYPIWRDEEMHALLLDAALYTAATIATSGRPVRTGQHVMLRVDLILTNSNSKAKFFVNEAHYFNDAVLMMNVWPLPASAQAQKHDLSLMDDKKSDANTLQLEQDSMQAGMHSQRSDLVFPGHSDVVMEVDGNTALLRLVDDASGRKASSPRPTDAANNASAPPPVCTVQMPSIPAESSGLLLADRLWQEVTALAANHVSMR